MEKLCGLSRKLGEVFIWGINSVKKDILWEKERSLIEEQYIVTTTITMGLKEFFNSLPKSERDKYSFLASEQRKRWIYEKFAQHYISDSALSLVFVEGLLQDLTKGGSMKYVADALHISWKVCIEDFRKACAMFMENYKAAFLG